MRRPGILMATAVVFIVCLGIGFSLAKIKPLWNDEIYSQVVHIDNTSYKTILAGDVSEGNVSPLFYLTQKVLCQVFGYSLEFDWATGQRMVDDFFAKMFLRINPVFFMSLAITFIFYFFGRYYSFLAGAYSFLIALSSYMVWAFWAEARPYALWSFLTTAQLLIFLALFQTKLLNKQLWVWLVVSNIALAFCSIFSVGQTMALSLLLWLFLEKRLKPYILLTLVPAIIAVFYYLKSPKYIFWFADSPSQLVRANIPSDRLVIFLVFALFILFSFLISRKNIVKFIQQTQFQLGLMCLLYVVMIFIATLGIMVLFKLKEPSVAQGFQVSSRYFIYLTPIGIIATTLFSIELIKACQGRKFYQILTVIGLLFLLIFRATRTLALIRGYYHLNG